MEELFILLAFLFQLIFQVDETRQILLFPCRLGNSRESHV